MKPQVRGTTVHCAALWWALRSASYSVLWEGLDLDFGSRGRGERKGSPQSDFPTIHMHVCVCMYMCVHYMYVCLTCIVCFCICVSVCMYMCILCVRVYGVCIKCMYGLCVLCVHCAYVCMYVCIHIFGHLFQKAGDNLDVRWRKLPPARE